MEASSLSHIFHHGPGSLPLPERVAVSAWMSHIPFAFWLVEATRPRLLVELGSYTGVSFCAFCQQVARLGLEADCYAVDTWQGDANMGAYDHSVYEELEAYVRERYASFACLIRTSFDEALEFFTPESIDLLHIDGYHSYEAMLHDFETWLPRLSARGVVLMHDINTRLPGYGGVRAWEEISSRFPSFAFTHGYGLGVVLVGAEPPESLLRLVEQGKEPAFAERVRGYYRQVGAMYARLFTEREKAAERQRADAERIADLQNTVAELRNALHGYESSLSWRMTRPLRRMAQGLRSLRRCRA